jgi:hypothetical protein
MKRLIFWLSVLASGGIGVLILNTPWFSAPIRIAAAWYALTTIAVFVFVCIWTLSRFIGPLHNSGRLNFFSLWDN